MGNHSSKDQFIISLQKEQQNRAQVDGDSRRLVFVSMIGLFNSYLQCPAHLLLSAIVVLPLRKKWLQQPLRYSSKIRSHVASAISGSEEQLRQFVIFLRWKMSQDLAFFMLDHYEQYKTAGSSPPGTEACNPVAPFWLFFSNKLQQLNYEPLNLDRHWWTNDFEVSDSGVPSSPFGVSSSDMLSELFHLTMKYKTIAQLVYQANPETLRPIQRYGERFSQCSSSCLLVALSDSKEVEAEDDEEEKEEPVEQKEEQVEHEKQQEQEDRQERVGDDKEEVPTTTMMHSPSTSSFVDPFGFYKDNSLLDDGQSGWVVSVDYDQDVGTVTAPPLTPDVY